MSRPTTYGVRRGRVATACAALLAALAGLAVTARAQAPDGMLDGVGGTSYVVAFPDTVRTAFDERYPNTKIRSEASLWIYSARKNRVRIEHASGEYKTEILLDSAQFKPVKLPVSTVVETSNTPVRWAFFVEADYPIVLVCYMADNQGLEAWMPQPVALWGQSYRAAAIPGEVVSELGIPGEVEIPTTPKAAPAEIVVIAAHDDTHVTLTPPPGAGFEGNPPRMVTLRRGEVYQVQSIVDLTDGVERQQDITATRIEADKPVGVISGNTRAQVDRDEEGIKNNVYKNLMLEWLRPVEQYGRQFVYLPTWDAHRAGIGAQAARKREYVRLYPDAARSVSGTFRRMADSGALSPTETAFTVEPNTMAEFPLAPYDAASFTAEAPMQAMMHSSSIVKPNGTTPCFRGLPCISYSAWAPYMVEMVPREQWAGFAPYYAPPNPPGMQHYVNVVTDTVSARGIYREDGSRFIFTRAIPGTDLVWGTMAVNPGETHWLAGKNGATFGGFVYGVLAGSEDYRPGTPGRKREGRSSASGGDGGAPSPLHPCEFEEYTGASYGYPLISMGRVLRAADSIVIDTVRSCTGLTIKARAVSDNPAGFRSAALDPAANVNARLTAIDPVAMADVAGRSSIELMVDAIDPRHPASGVVVLTDRTGKIWRIPFTTESKFLVFEPRQVRFDSIPAGLTTERMVRIVNTLGHPLTVDMVRLARGNEGYVIVATNPHGPAEQPPSPVVIAPGSAMTVTVRALPPAGERTNSYVDSVKISYDCGWESLPLDVNRTAASAGRIEDAEGRRLDVSAEGDLARIRYATGRPGPVRLSIHDEMGRHVETLVDMVQDAAGHTAEWNASAWASGVYYCVIESGGWRRSVPLVIVR